ncbi:MAG: hypothetical protein KKA73_09325, partial [Chloroflexi bacterium]|nr:hypothetical protein [Chloroflexota bacterium]
DEVGRLGGGLGSPLMLMLRPDLGDQFYPDLVVSHPGQIDEMYVLVETTPERAAALQGGVEFMGERKLKRKVRTRITKGQPGVPWRVNGATPAGWTPPPPAAVENAPAQPVQLALF